MIKFEKIIPMINYAQKNKGVSMKFSGERYVVFYNENNEELFRWDHSTDQILISSAEFVKILTQEKKISSKEITTDRFDNL